MFPQSADRRHVHRSVPMSLPLAVLTALVVSGAASTHDDRPKVTRTPRSGTSRWASAFSTPLLPGTVEGTP